MAAPFCSHFCFPAFISPRPAAPLRARLRPPPFSCYDKGMLYSPRIRAALAFALKVHETDQKQKRRGKDVPYIVHPAAVGMILSRAGADEDTVIAGLLHDTIEDSAPDYRVTRPMIEDLFGARVADLVTSVTEAPKSVPWESRKEEALAHIAEYSHESLLLKSADTVSNAGDLVDDWKREGDRTFARFAIGKERFVGNYRRVIAALLAVWDGNPLAEDLRALGEELGKMG